MKRRNIHKYTSLLTTLILQDRVRLLRSFLTRNDGAFLIRIQLLGAFLMMGMTVQAQQTPLFSAYHFNKFLINPAFTGIDNEYRAFGVFRSQWVDIPGSPVTGGVTLEGSFWQDRIGGGIFVLNDQIGIFNQTNVSGSYAQKIKFARHHQIALGVQGSAFINQIDFNQTQATDFNDPSLEGQEKMKTTFDLNAGISYKWKSLLLGFCVPQVLQPDAAYGNTSTVSTTYTYVRHYNAFAQYKIGLADDKFNITPSLLLRKGDASDLQFDATLLLDYDDKVFAGAGYRTSFGVMAMAGLNVFDMFTVAYAYDLTTQKQLKGHVGNTHEIVVGFHLPCDYKKNKQDELIDPTKEDLTRGDLERSNDSLSQQLRETELERDSLLNLLQSTYETKEELEQLAEELFDNQPQKDGDTTESVSYRLNKLFFDKNQDTLRESSHEQLDMLVDFLKNHPKVEIIVQGYADSTGSAEHNQILSENRARSVVDYLTDHGISSDRLTYKGYGEANPIADNGTPKGQQKNRRVEFTITKW